MNCPLCDADMEGASVCPQCGTPLASELPSAPAQPLPGIFYENLRSAQETYEQEHQPKKAPRFDKTELRILSGAILLLFLIVGLLWFSFRQYDPDAAAIRGDRGIYMDNRVFSIYYKNAYLSFVSQYSDSLPFRQDRSLKKQYYNLAEGDTWEDYFVSEAFSSAALTELLVADARAHGFSLGEADRQRLDANWESLTLAADQNGKTTDAFLRAQFGSAVTPDAYREYLEASALAQAYSQALYNGFQFSDAELEAYCRDNQDTYSDLMISPLPNVKIRHVLYLPAEDTEEARNHARARAQEAMDALTASGCTEDSFSSLARQDSGDSGSREMGGLLEDLAPGQLSQEISDWCFAPEGRSYGDLTMAESDYGVHLLFFVDYRDNYRWKEQVLGDMRSNALAQYVTELRNSVDCHLTSFAGSPD